MSEIKVNSIKGVGASTAAITVNNTDGTCTANITNNLSNRNLIINGAMQVAQRGTSSTTSGYATVDRFRFLHGTVDESPTQEQADVAAGTTPYTNGFRKSYKITNGNQTSGAQASSVVRLQIKIEAQDIANSGWNYLSSSSYITFSFWIKSSVAQTFYGLIRSDDGTSQAYQFETGSLTADTWTKITKTIPGNSNLTFNNDNGLGFDIQIMAFMGTATTGSVTLNQWAAYNASARVPNNTTTWYTTNDATLEFTGVQLEVGSVATDFEHRTFAQELALCQRYFCQDFASNIGTMYEAHTGANGRFANFYFPVQMRAAPTVNTTNGVDGVVNSQFDNGSGGAVTVSKHASKSSAYFYNATITFHLTGLTTGSPGASFSAEL